MRGYLPTDYVQLGKYNLLYNTTLCVANEYVLTDVYSVSPQGIRQKICSSCSTNRQICACQNSIRCKGVLNGMLFKTRDKTKDFFIIKYKWTNLCMSKQH